MKTRILLKAFVSVLIAVIFCFQYESYEEQIQYLRDFINMLAEWIDKNI